MAGVVQIGNVVEQFNIGNTKVKICDDAYRDKTPEEIEETLKRITQRAYECCIERG